MPAGLTLAFLAGAQFLVVLDATVVNVALSPMGSSLDMSQRQLSWVVNAYTLASAGGILFGGHLVDRLGPRRPFIFGMTFFCVASAVAGFAPSGPVLIFARALQGFGATAMLPTFMATLMWTYPAGARRTRAIAILNAAATAGAPTGTLLGGVITQYLGWPWVFLINVPVALVALKLGLQIVPTRRSRLADRVRWQQAMLFTTALTLFVLWLISGNKWGWSSSTSLFVLAGAGVLFVCFVSRERLIGAALVPARLWSNSHVVWTNLVALIVGMQLYAAMFFLTLYLQNVLGYNPLQAGLAFVPVGLAASIASIACARALARHGPKAVLVVALCLLAAGLMVVSTATPGSGYGSIAIGLVLFGLGLGPAIASISAAAVHNIAVRDSGTASGLITTTTQVGGALGLAMAVGLHSVFPGGASESAHAEVLQGLQVACWLGAALTVIAAPLALATLPSRLQFVGVRGETVETGRT